MDIALKTKLKQLSLSAIKIIAGVAALYGLKSLTDTYGHHLGWNAFWVYAIIMVGVLYLAIKAFMLIIDNLSWFLDEIIHFMGTIWKSIVHLEFRSYTTLISEKAQTRRQIEARIRKRRAFVTKMTGEQKELYQIGFNDLHKIGYEKGTELGKQYGFNDGYSNNYKKNNHVAEFRWDHVR